MEPMIAKLGNFTLTLGEALQSYTALIGIDDEGSNSNGDEEGRIKHLCDLAEDKQGSSTKK